MRTARDWYDILVQCQVKPAVAAKWSEVFANTIKPTTFSKGDEEIDDFLGQILHESQGLVKMGEDLRYSPERLMAVWPNRFQTLEFAKQYANNPEKLANYVYGGRMGNTRPGDGWLYRGRSPGQITGHDNYVFVGNVIGQDLETMPELLEQPHYGLEATIAWWEGRIPDSMLGDPERITKRVNGSLLGLAHRAELADGARWALGRMA